MIVLAAEPNSLNRSIDNAQNSTGLARLVVEPLVAYDEQGVPSKDGLVTEWSRSSSDPNSWTLTLRSPVKFSNGEIFDAAAAAYSITLARDGRGTAASYLETVKSVTAVDATTLNVVTNSPMGFLPEVLTMVQAVPPKYFAQVDAARFGRAPIGTGPFTLTKWTVGQNLRFTRNADYWGSAAKLDTVTVRWNAEPATRIAMLKTGAAHIASQILPIDVNDLNHTPGLATMSVPSTQVMTLQMNTKSAPVNDIRVRKALAMAIDREALVKTVFGGIGARAHQDLFASSFGDFQLAGVPTYDPAAARALLKSVGKLPPLNFYWTVDRYMNNDQVGQAISWMLTDVGFEIVQRPMPSGAFLEYILKGNMDGLMLIGNGPTFHHQSFSLNSFFLSTSVVNYCNDPAIDAPAKRALSLVGSEADAAYRSIAEQLVVTNICPVNLYILNNIWGVSDKVRGFKPASNESLLLTDVTLAM